MGSLLWWCGPQVIPNIDWPLPQVLATIVPAHLAGRMFRLLFKKPSEYLLLPKTLEPRGESSKPQQINRSTFRAPVHGTVPPKLEYIFAPEVNSPAKTLTDRLAVSFHGESQAS